MGFPKPYAGAPSPVLPATSASALTTTHHTTPPIRGPPDLADDLLEGAEAIASFMFGDPSLVRAVYRLSTEVSAEHRAPFFKLGSGSLCARKSTLLKWIESKEQARLAECK
jgi:hypothetical protein